jgi:hypothetical protein
MGETNEMLGIGDVFVIGGQEFNAHIATFEELETIDKKTDGLYLHTQGIAFNFKKLAEEKDNKGREDRAKKFLALLQTIFPDAPVENLKKMNRKEMAKAIEYFLFS